MKPRDIETLVAYRMERSNESIAAAKIMFENNMLTFSMNRIYYAKFYAVSALLLLHGITF